MHDYRTLWKNACNERIPDPTGAVGALIRALAEHLDVEEVEYDHIGGAALFLLDLSKLGFKGMDLNVVMVTHPPTGEQEQKVQLALLAQYKHAVQSVGFCFHLFLSHTPPVDASLVPDYLDAVLMAGDDVERIFTSKLPESVLFGIIRRQVQIQWLCPFNVTEEARGAMFKGRKSELDRLTRELDRHFMITGARRIGKTSLLHKAYDVLRMHPPLREHRVYFLNCLTWGDYSDCIKQLARNIAPKKEIRMEKGRHNVSYMLREASAGGSKPLLLLFDELDAVVEADYAAEGWPFFRMLKEAASAGYVRLCFAGYRSMARLTHDGSARRVVERGESSSPFYGALTPLRLMPLSRPEADSLITSPFRALEIHLADEGRLKEELWIATKGFPFMVQFYGERLFSLAMHRTPYAIEPGDVDSVNRSHDLTRFLELHFLDNTRRGDAPVKSERLCAYLHATKSGGQLWTNGDFLKQCQDAGLSLTVDELSEALENLVDANVLEWEENRYRITFESLARFLCDSYKDAASYISSLEQR
jgi:hypothetical protein